jgi:phosphatidyl-myo-inositol dimannoside synthase
MKILFLTLNTFDKRGGIQTFNGYFMKALDANEYSWKMISLHDVSGNVANNIYCCGSSLVKFIMRLIQFAERDTILVWNHISLGVLHTYLYPLLRNKRNILLAYGTEVWNHDLPPRKKTALSCFDEIWAISNYTKKKLVKTHKLLESKFRIFPCCISLSNGVDYPDPYPSNRFDILTLMRLEIEPKLSAIYNVVDAIPGLLGKGVPAHFTIVGRGNGEETLRRYVAKLGLEAHVTFTGFVDDPAPYLQHCDVFTLISDVEGFGIVYLEAMQYGKCCVAARNCGSEDVVLDGDTGLSVPVNDISALEAALAKLAAEEPLRLAMGERGRQHLLDNFTFNSFRKNQWNLFEG